MIFICLGTEAAHFMAKEDWRYADIHRALGAKNPHFVVLFVLLGSWTFTNTLWGKVKTINL